MTPFFIFKTILSCLHLEEKDFLYSRKRPFVEARTLFVYFYIREFKPKKYGTYTLLGKMLGKKHNTIIYYNDVHSILLKTNVEYRTKYTLVNQYLNDSTRTTD